MDYSTANRPPGGPAAAIRAGAVTAVVVLPTLWSMLQLHLWWSPPVDAIVFAVMLAVALSRALTRIAVKRMPLAIGLFPVAVAAAVACGMLIDAGGTLPVAGAGLFSIGVAVPVWLRRFGAAWQAAGTLGALPYFAVMVEPTPAERTWAFVGWMLLGAAVALGWALLARIITAPTPLVESSTTRPGKQLRASTRMAIQLAVATATAFAAAKALDPHHLVWPVLTVLITHSGNRGRGDVLVKGTQRIIGALAGTGIAAVASGLFSPGDDTGLVALFAAIVLAAAARPYGYVYWAAGITAALVFLYGYFEQSGIDLLGHRLLGILAGGIIALATAWFLLPVRTLDVARKRLARLLAAATDVATMQARAQPTDAAAHQLRDANQQLADLDATARTGRRLRLQTARTLDAALNDAHRLTDTLVSITDVRADRTVFANLARALAHTRRSLAERKPFDTIATQLTELLDRARSLRPAR